MNLSSKMLPTLLKTFVFVWVLATSGRVYGQDDEASMEMSSVSNGRLVNMPVVMNNRRRRRRKKPTEQTIKIPPPDPTTAGTPNKLPPVPAVPWHSVDSSSSSSKSGKGGKKGSSSSKKGKSGKKSKSGKKCKKSSKPSSSFSRSSCDDDEEMETLAPTLAPTVDLGPPTAGPTAAATSTLAPTIPVPTSPPSASMEPTGLGEPSESPSMMPSGLDFDTTLDLSQVATQYQQAFTDAATRWDTIIVRDEPNVQVTAQDKMDSQCLDANIPDEIDDIFICAVIEEIDGVSGVLGSAGPELAVFGDSVRPFVGRMRFDVADVDKLVADGGFPGVILHEMGHVYGIGTLWDTNKLLGADSCSYNTGNKATSEWQALSGCTTPLPLEQDGGPGTACGHWDEDCFVDEIMTGYNTGGLPISRITVGTLEDLGYGVNYGAADPFPASTLGPCRCNNIQEAGESNGEVQKLNELVTITTVAEPGNENKETGAVEEVEQTEAKEGEEEKQKTGNHNLSGSTITKVGSTGSVNKLGGTHLTKITNTVDEAKSEVKSSRHGTRGRVTGKVIGGGRRKLSEEGRKIAIEYGKKELNLRKEKRQRLPDRPDRLYIGEKYLSVLYEEDGQVFGVDVWSDELEESQEP